MGLENQSLVATGESQCKDKYALVCVCVCQLSPEEGKRRNGTLERRLLSNEQKERMENLIKQMPGTPLLHDLQNRKGGRATEPVLRAEAWHAEQVFTRHPRLREGRSGFSWIQAAPEPLPPGLSPWHSIVQVLTYLPALPFLILPAGTPSLGAFSLGDLLLLPRAELWCLSAN